MSARKRTWFFGCDCGARVEVSFTSDDAGERAAIEEACRAQGWHLAAEWPGEKPTIPKYRCSPPCDAFAEACEALRVERFAARAEGAAVTYDYDAYYERLRRCIRARNADREARGFPVERFEPREGYARACFVCGERATSWSGHVHDAEGRKIVAGWCDADKEMQATADSTILSAIAGAFPGRAALRERLEKDARPGCVGCYGDEPAKGNRP